MTPYETWHLIGWKKGKDAPWISHNALETFYSAMLTWHIVLEDLLILSLGQVVKLSLKFATCPKSPNGCSCDLMYAKFHKCYQHHISCFLLFYCWYLYQNITASALYADKMLSIVLTVIAIIMFCYFPSFAFFRNLSSLYVLRISSQHSVLEKYPILWRW